jgi:hypothetical protein
MRASAAVSTSSNSRPRRRVCLAALLASFALLCPTTQARGGPKESVDRSYALLRLPGQNGGSCLSCHREDRFPEVTTSAALREHVAGQVPGIPAVELAAFQRYLATLASGPTMSPQVSSAEMLEAVRALGYVEYRAATALPVLRRGLRLNAHELSLVATGSARLVANRASPTGMALELDGTHPTGLVLPPAGADPGTYVLKLRLAGPVPETPLRMSLTGPGQAAIDQLLRLEPASTEAAAIFQIDRPVRLTIALAPNGTAPISITELIAERR